MISLTDAHLADLKSSGLTDETIRESGVFSATARETRAILGFASGPGLVFPYPGDSPLQRVKPDRPFGSHEKSAKYLSPKRELNPGGNRLYFPSILAGSVFGDTSVRLLVTEGEKKTLAGCQEGFPTIGLAGVTCWVSRNGDGNSHPVADLDLIDWRARDVAIVFDSDAASKPEVRREEKKLARELQQRGAKVRIARLPRPTSGESGESGELGGKFGLDDFLKVRGKAAFEAILQKARTVRDVKQSDKPAFYEVARDFLDANGLADGSDLLLRWHRSTFHRWTGHAYQAWPDEDVRAAVLRHAQSRADLQDRCTRHLTSNVVANLEAMCSVASNVQPPAWLGADAPYEPSRAIALTNGVLDVGALMASREDVLRPSSSEFFVLNALPFAFDPEAECPLWLATLRRILPDPEVRELLQEWFGYCLTPETWLQVFVALLGEGANGKSVVCKVLASILGEDNVSAVPIERFRETHSLVGTLNRLANVVSEFEEIDRATEGALKAFVTGDAMEFNPKFKATFTARPSARLTVATNALPHIKDKSSGLWRRMVVIHFPVQLAPADQDPHLPAKLLDERPGIFNWALAGLSRLLARGRLVQPESSIQARESHRRNCNPARTFLDEHLETVTGSELTKMEVYREYASFCRDSGYQPMGEATFAKEVFRAFPDTAAGRRRIGGVRINVYTNLQWASPVPGVLGVPGPLTQSVRGK